MIGFAHLIPDQFRRSDARFMMFVDGENFTIRLQEIFERNGLPIPA